MGTLVATYSERDRRFYPIAQKLELKPEGVRRVRASPLRYCLGANYLYLPAKLEAEIELSQLCWARVPTHVADEIAFENSKSTYTTLDDIERLAIRVGDRYLKRHKEVDGKFVAVDQFCSQELLDGLAENPEALPTVSNADFEALCAELFARRGFEVDLFRGTGDGGIDFLALNDGQSDPIIFAVQCKQPEIREGKKRRSLGRPVVQQIYGAAKAWDMKGGIAISGSTYSPQAKTFSTVKPDEIKVYDGGDLLKWISIYRWNMDEK